MLYKYLLYSTILISFINIISSICIQDGNCPSNSGVCNLDICECLPGYKTLINDNNTNQVFCNYKQYSKWVPFILEFIFPSIGLFFIRRIFHGFIKLTLFIPLIWGSWNISFIWVFFFVLMYIIDLLGLYFKFYADGNGISLY